MRNIIILVLLALCFIIPVHFFILGNDVGYGIQGAYYQIKVTGYGTNFFTITSDFMYSIQGIYSGRTLISDIFWLSGSMLLTIGTLIWLINEKGIHGLKLLSGLLIIVTGIIYFISVIVQYGIFLNGPAGVSIPFGIPLIIFIGYWMVYSNIFANTSDNLCSNRNDKE